MADNLPTPLIITEILSRLPVKSLLRFRCVSKPWKSTIDDPHFVKLHLKHSLEIITNNTLILLKDSSLYSVDFPPLNQASKIDYPIQNENCLLAVVGSCNGLLCLIDRELELEPIIYNPATKHQTKVPFSIEFPFKEMQLLPLEELAYGFGYDQVNDDYKLVRIVQIGSIVPDKFYSEVKVYSLKMNSWTRARDLCDEHVLIKRRDCGVYVNGCLHWMVGKNPFEDDFIPMLVAFNLGSLEWKFVAQPEYSAGLYGGCWAAVRVLTGCLSVARNYPMERCEVWVMMEYGVDESWTKLFILSETMIEGSLDRVLPIAYSKDRSKVLIVQDLSKLFWSDLPRQTIESVKIPGMAIAFVSEMLVESLVSLGSQERKTPKRKSDNLDGFLSKGFKLKL